MRGAARHRTGHGRSQPRGDVPPATGPPGTAPRGRCSPVASPSIAPNHTQTHGTSKPEGGGPLNHPALHRSLPYAPAPPRQELAMRQHAGSPRHHPWAVHVDIRNAGPRYADAQEGQYWPGDYSRQPGRLGPRAHTADRHPERPRTRPDRIQAPSKPVLRTWDFGIANGYQNIEQEVARWTGIPT